MVTDEIGAVVAVQFLESGHSALPIGFDRLDLVADSDQAIKFNLAALNAFGVWPAADCAFFCVEKLDAHSSNHSVTTCAVAQVEHVAKIVRVDVGFDGVAVFVVDSDCSHCCLQFVVKENTQHIPPPVSEGLAGKFQTV